LIDYLQLKLPDKTAAFAAALTEMMQDKDAEKARRVTQAMLQMKKIDIAGLKRAYEQA